MAILPRGRSATTGPAQAIPADLAQRAHELLGGHPFYLQVLGEALAGGGDAPSLKAALAETLFSRTGRLGLYFENEFQRLVGRATTLAATLQALAAAPRRLTEIATAIGAPSGSTARYLDRLGDAVVRDEDGLYRLADPAFGLWLRWREPGGTVVPMTLLGDEAERRVSEELARMGFVLVMAADAERLGWRFVVAARPPGDREPVLFLDLAAARRSRGVALDREAAIPNLLAWLGDGGPRRGRARKKRTAR